MADEPLGYGFDLATVRMIEQTVRRVLATPFGSTVSRESLNRTAHTFYLARAQASGGDGDLIEFLVRHPDGDKGSEVDSTDTYKAYVRRGVVTTGKDYVIMSLCVADDSPFEVVNPDTPLSLDRGTAWGGFWCIYPAFALGNACGVCRCTADPWVIDPGLPDALCNDNGVVKMGGVALWFSATDSGATECVWRSADQDTSTGRSFFYELHILSDETAELTLFERVGSDTIATFRWNVKKWCCFCRNCFEAECPPVLPVPCGFPDRFCLYPPKFSEAFGVGNSCIDLCAQVPVAYEISVPDGTYGDIACGCNDMATTCLTGGTLTLIRGTGGTGDCGWQGKFRCFDLDYLKVWTLSFPTGFDAASGDVTLQFQISVPGDTCIYGGSLVKWSIPFADWDCTGENTLTLSDADHCATPPATITVKPAQVLVDQNGDPILDETGSYILLRERILCSSEGEVTCADRPAFTPGFTTWLCTADGWVLCEGSPSCPDTPGITCGGGSASVGDFIEIACGA